MTMVVEKTIVREIDASVASCMWNYWDHDHLAVVHKNYLSAKIIYENDNSAIYLLRYQALIPFFRTNSLNVMVRTDTNTLKAVNQGFLGTLAVTTIKMDQITSERTRITMTYKFLLSGWKTLFRKILPPLIERWNKQVWEEDLELKLRREKVLRYGFKDFQGLPKDIEDRKFDGDLICNLPIQRHKQSPLNLFL